MGSQVNIPDLSGPSDGSNDNDLGLGDLVSGRLDDVDIDSVTAVRELREDR